MRCIGLAVSVLLISISSGSEVLAETEATQKQSVLAQPRERLIELIAEEARQEFKMQDLWISKEIDPIKIGEIYGELVRIRLDMLNILVSSLREAPSSVEDKMTPPPRMEYPEGRGRNETRIGRGGGSYTVCEHDVTPNVVRICSNSDGTWFWEDSSGNFYPGTPNAPDLSEIPLAPIP